MCAARTWGDSRSGSEYTATASRPSSWQARMIRRAISPRLATRTRLMVVMTPCSAMTSPHLARYFERRHWLAQRRRDARRPRVRGERRLGPGVIGVQRYAQRPEHEVARRDPRALPLRTGHPDERPSFPAHARAGFGWSLERHAHAHRTSPGQLREPRDRKSTRLNSSHGYISYAVF